MKKVLFLLTQLNVKQGAYFEYLYSRTVVAFYPRVYCNATKLLHVILSYPGYITLRENQTRRRLITKRQTKDNEGQYGGPEAHCPLYAEWGVAL